MRAWAVLVAVALSIIAMIGGIVITIQDNRDDCRDAVRVREVHRAMWQAAFDLFPDSDEVMELRIILNDRLPQLICVGSTPTPVPSEEIFHEP